MKVENNELVLQYCIIMGHTGVGKTTELLNKVRAANENGERALVISMENTEDQMATKLANLHPDLKLTNEQPDICFQSFDTVIMYYHVEAFLNDHAAEFDHIFIDMPELISVSHEGRVTDRHTDVMRMLATFNKKYTVTKQIARCSMQETPILNCGMVDLPLAN